MSLEGLFTDRKVRKLIKESVLNAQENINSECSCCHKKGNTLKIGEYSVCESCAGLLNEITEDYDRAFESSYMDINNVIKEEIVNEAICKIGNFQKLKDETNQKYGGDLAKLFKAYEIQKPYNCGTIIPKNRDEVELLPTDLTGGNSKVNRFIDDFDIQLSTRAKNTLVADPDGYLSKSVGSQNSTNQSSTSTTLNTPSKPTVKGATQQKPVKTKGPGFSVEGDESKFDIKIADDIFIECTLDLPTSTTSVNCYEIKLKGTNEKPFTFNVKTADMKEMASTILSEIKKTPCNVFTSFDDDFDSTKGYILNEYPQYSFMFDDDSFDGKALTVVLALNGVPYAKSRIQLTQKDIISKASLDGKLLRSMKERLSAFYPMLFDGSMNIQTSIGKAVSSFVSVDNSNKVKIQTDIGNETIEWETLGSDLKEKELSINSMLHAIYDNLDKIIPEWSKTAFRSKTKVKGYTDSFNLLTEVDYDAYLNFSLDELFDTYNFVFHMSVIDKQTGIEQPKEFEPVIYNKPGVRLSDFAKMNGNRLYKKYFNKSDMVDTLSKSAQEKLKNRSKREVFLSYLADTLKRSLGNDNLKNLDLDIEDFDVNADHKVTNVVFRVSDPYNDVAGTSSDLKDIIKVDRESWIKLVKADDSPKSMKDNGPSVIYKVTKIKDFSDCVNLPLLENAMLEAFGFISGRKVIGINEAYWKVVDGEYTLVF